MAALTEGVGTTRDTQSTVLKVTQMTQHDFILGTPSLPYLISQALGLPSTWCSKDTPAVAVMATTITQQCS